MLLSRQDAWFDPHVQDASLPYTCLPFSKAVAAATSLSSPGSRASSIVHSLWILARVLPSLPLPPSDSPRRGAVLRRRAIRMPWKYAAVEPLNQLEGARSEVYLEKGFAVRRASTDSFFRNCHFWRRCAPLPPSLHLSLPSARGRLWRPTQTLRIRACSGEHVLSINKTT